jgi:hypothetical protein
MAKLVLTMTMSLDGFFSGPGGELDWMTQVPDPEFSRRPECPFRVSARLFDCSFCCYGDTGVSHLPALHGQSSLSPFSYTRWGIRGRLKP